MLMNLEWILCQLTGNIHSTVTSGRQAHPETNNHLVTPHGGDSDKHC